MATSRSCTCARSRGPSDTAQAHESFDTRNLISDREIPDPERDYEQGGRGLFSRSCVSRGCFRRLLRGERRAHVRFVFRTVSEGIFLGANFEGLHLRGARLGSSRCLVLVNYIIQLAGMGGITACSSVASPGFNELFRSFYALPSWETNLLPRGTRLVGLVGICR